MAALVLASGLRRRAFMRLLVGDVPPLPDRRAERPFQRRRLRSSGRSCMFLRRIQEGDPSLGPFRSSDPH
jgi:hypothetical protein